MRWVIYLGIGLAVIATIVGCTLHWANTQYDQRLQRTEHANEEFQTLIRSQRSFEETDRSVCVPIADARERKQLFTWSRVHGVRHLVDTAYALARAPWILEITPPNTACCTCEGMPCISVICQLYHIKAHYA